MAGCNTTLVIDGSYDGFLTVIHGHYYKKWRPADIVCADAFQQTLDTTYIDVDTDYEKSKTVQRAISTKISFAAAETCYAAFAVETPEKYMPLYHYITLGFKVGRSLNDHTHNDDVLKVLALAKTALNEAYLLKEFVRFSETESGVFYASLSPVHNVLPFLAEHFIDRFMSHAWVIHDVVRGIALLYDTKQCLLTDTPKNAAVRHADCEEHYQKLWTGFFNAITIESRKNKKLQRQLLPLHFRKHMTEHVRNELQKGVQY